MEVGIQLIGDRRVALRFDKFPEIAREKLLAVITQFQGNLFSAIQAKIPRGKTGNIANALEGGVENSKYKVRGWVSLMGGDVNKVILPAAALEYGSNSSITVKAKEGRVLRTVYGRYINPMLVNVSSYDRTTNIAAQRFMRGPLEDMSSSAINAMSQAVQEAVEAA
jgi:hypothetical protein